MSSKANPYHTVLIIVVGLSIIAVWEDFESLLYGSLIAGALASVSSTIAQFIHQIWMKLGWLLGLVMPKIVLTVIYFIFLTPIALLANLFRKQPPIQKSPLGKSSLKMVNKKFTAADFDEMW